MSWDISVQDMPKDAKSVDDISDDFQPEPLGPRKELIERILKILPDVDFEDPSWGILRREGVSIEFNMGREEICDGFMLHVRSGGDTVNLIHYLLESLKLKAFDCSEGDFFRIDTAGESYQNWKKFRDRVIDDN